MNRSKQVPTVLDFFPALFEEGTRLNDNFLVSANTLLDNLWDTNNFNSTFFTNNIKKRENKFPKINVQDIGDAFKVEIAVAGFDKDSVELEFKDNALYVKTSTNNDTESKNDGYVVREIARSSFRRYIPLPEKVDVTKVNDDCVVYKDGIITCTLDKQEAIVDKGVKLNLG